MKSAYSKGFLRRHVIRANALGLPLAALAVAVPAP
jgi:hypothetical protein